MTTTTYPTWFLGASCADAREVEARASTVIRAAAIRGCSRGDGGPPVPLVREDAAADPELSEAVNAVGLDRAAALYREVRDAWSWAVRNGAPLAPISERWDG